MTKCEIERAGPLLASPESLPDSVLERLRELSDACPGCECEIAGGLDVA